MASSNDDSNVQNLKRDILIALCKYLSLDPEVFLRNLDGDITSLCCAVLKSSENEESLIKNGEVLKWLGFAEKFVLDSGACIGNLNELNEELIQKSVLLGNGLRPSVVDVVVFSAVHSFVVGLSGSERGKLPHLLRWMDYIQSKEDFGKLYESILLESEKVQFEPQVVSKPVKRAEVDLNAKNTVQAAKEANVSAAVINKMKVLDGKKAAAEKSAPAEKKLLEKVVDDKEVSVNLLKIQVGVVRKAWKHPSADSLLVEEIDVGDAKCRQVVSGLAKYLIPDDLTNRRVVLITNVKHGKLRDIMSEGLVLCASNEDHTIVEPLIAPEDAKIGEIISFSGHEGKPEDILNPKKKQLEKITPHLFTDERGVATFKGIPFMTSGGPCTSSIPKASIK